MVVGFLPFMLKLIETSTFSGSVNRRISLNYEFADFTYRSDVEKTVSLVEARTSPCVSSATTWRG